MVTGVPKPVGHSRESCVDGAADLGTARWRFDGFPKGSVGKGT